MKKDCWKEDPPVSGDLKSGIPAAVLTPVSNQPQDKTLAINVVFEAPTCTELFIIESTHPTK